MWPFDSASSRGAPTASGTRPWYIDGVKVDVLTPEERRRWDQLDAEQRAFVTEREPLWRRAHEIAAKNPSVDVGDIYHVLVSLRETPTQRLARSLRRGRLLARAR